MTELSDRGIITIYMGILWSINSGKWSADKFDPRRSIFENPPPSENETLFQDFM
jgi:hypothetical protein